MKVLYPINPNTGNAHLNIDLAGYDVLDTVIVDGKKVKSPIFSHNTLVSLYYAAKAQKVQSHKDDWYRDALQYAQGLADEYNVDVAKVVHVISALSPVTEWELNKRRAKTVIDAWANNISPRPPGHMYGKNTDKAYAILDGLPYKLGTKTEKFARNILGDYSVVTVDSIAAGAALGFGFLPGTVKLPDVVYNVVEKLYIDAAKIVGEAPAMLQAIVWEYVRLFRPQNSGSTYLYDMYSKGFTLFQISQDIEAKARLQLA